MRINRSFSLLSLCTVLFLLQTQITRSGGVAGEGLQNSIGKTQSEITTITLPGGVPLELVKIPHGSFQMGSPNTERNRFSDEGPVHTVTIGYDFYMGKYLLTQKQWLAVMGSWPGKAPNSSYGQGDNYPAYYICWDDCQNFITALNAYIVSTKQGSASFHLPSESEWEYACRAGTQTRFFFGDSLSVNDDADGPAGTLPGNRSDYMWWGFNCWGDANGAYGSKPVGTKLPNQFGLYDMSGNVVEWCEDWCHDFRDPGRPDNGSAWETPPSGDPYPSRELRGGGWYFATYNCRSAQRWGDTPDFRDYYYGMRLARSFSNASAQGWERYD